MSGGERSRPCIDGSGMFIMDMSMGIRGAGKAREGIDQKHATETVKEGMMAHHSDQRGLSCLISTKYSAVAWRGKGIEGSLWKLKFP